MAHSAYCMVTFRTKNIRIFPKVHTWSGLMGVPIECLIILQAELTWKPR